MRLIPGGDTATLAQSRSPIALVSPRLVPSPRATMTVVGTEDAKPDHAENNWARPVARRLHAVTMPFTGWEGKPGNSLVRR